MKKLIAIILFSTALNSIYAQDIYDAIRFAQTDLNGTARFKAMGGAFGAVGGDFSSLNVNPAGSLIFSNNQVGVTLSNFNTCNESNYFGNTTTSNKNSLDINQAGAVFSFINKDKKSDWRKFAFSINYENAKNLDNNIYSSGTNPNNSIGNYFLSYANGVPLANIDGSNYYYDELYFNEQQAYLGYNSYIIDPNANTGNNTTYNSNIASGGNYDQENRIQSNGYNGKVTFNFAGQYTDKWLFGLNLSSHFLDYRQSSYFYETKNNSNVKDINFNNELYTYGSGFSFQIGTIFKPMKELRVGISYESPTWFRLTDELNQRISASVFGLSSSPNGYSTEVTDPNTTMVFVPYNLQTPSKLTSSFAYIFGKRGLISFDIASKNYANTTYRPKQDFSSTNAIMSNELTTSSEVRIGGEYKIKKVSLRGGYRWEQSPFKNKTTIGDLTGYSAGFGYNFGNTKLDVAYAYAKRDYNQQFFSQGLTDAARINAINNTISITLLFEL
jgi:hypothetical protein